MEKVKVSVCIPTYNGATYLKETLLSIEKQTYTDFEIVISDDKSIDSTLDVVEKFKQISKKTIKLVYHKPNGIGSNWNNCINNASGKFIKFVFQDDILLPTCIEEMVSILDENNRVGLIACQREFIYSQSFYTEELAQWINQFGNLQNGLNLKKHKDYSILDYRFFKSKQFLKSPMNKVGEPSAVMFRKDIVNEIGFFREDLKQILDYEFYYRLLKLYDIAIIDRVLVKFRLHDKQTTVVNKQTYGENEDDFPKILYSNYLNYVDDYTKLHLLKKYNLSYKIYYYFKQFFK